MKLLYKLTISILFSCSALCTNKVGNGGDGVFCKKDGKTAGELLDFYENEIKLASTSAKAKEIAEKYVENLRTIAPKLHKQYIRRLNELPNEIEYKNEIELVDIKDSQHLYKPASKECEVLQVAVRKLKNMPKEKRFIIREDLWNQMDEVSKAGLFTHEIIYEHLSKLGEESSVKARKLNAFIYQNDLTKDSFWSYVKDLEIPLYP